MNYELRYSPRAQGQLAALPADLTSDFDRQLRALSSTPTALSVPIASPPFPPRGQLFHFESRDGNGRNWFFTVIFCYSQDESALHVLSVTWRELDDG
jgi:hypothetical protein